MTRKERILTALIVGALFAGAPLFFNAYNSYVEGVATAKDAAAILTAAPVGEFFVLGFVILPFVLAAAGTILAIGLLYLIIGLLEGAPPAKYLVAREEPIVLDEWTALIQAGEYETDETGQVIFVAGQGETFTATFTDSGISVSLGSANALFFSRKIAKSLCGYVQQIPHLYT